MNRHHCGSTTSYYRSLYSKYSVADTCLQTRQQRRATGAFLEKIELKEFDAAGVISKRQQKRLNRAFRGSSLSHAITKAISVAALLAVFHTPLALAHEPLSPQAAAVSTVKSGYQSVLTDDEQLDNEIEHQTSQPNTSLHLLSQKAPYTAVEFGGENTLLIDEDSDIAWQVEKGQSLTVIDTSIESWQEIHEAVIDGEILLLQEKESLDAIINKLQSMGRVEALSIYTHGSSGALYFNGEKTSIDSLVQQADKWQQLGSYLATEGDIHLLGCSVAEGEKGRAFITKIADLTNADVAASINPTGSIEAGGDWTLELIQGDIESRPLLSQRIEKTFTSVLAAIGTVDFETPANHTDPGSYNAGAGVNATYSLGGTYPMLIDGTANSVEIYGGGPFSIYTGSTSTLETAVTFSLSGGQTFDVGNIDVGNWTGGPIAFTFTPTTGTPVTSASFAYTTTNTVPLNFSGITGFTVTGSASFIAGFDNLTSVNAYPVPTNAAPTLGGSFTTAGAVNDNATTTPFSAVTVADADGDNVSVAITYTGANGTLSGTGVSGSAGNYTISSAAPTTATTNLQGITFTPTANQATPGTAVVTAFTLTPNDGTVDGTANSTTQISATSINDAPTNIALSNASVNQSGGTNAAVGTLSNTDVDTGQSYTYSLAVGTGDTDNASFNISGTTLQASNAATLAAGSYSVRINVNDGAANFAKAFSISVADDVAPAVTSVSVPNNATYGTGQSLDFTVNTSENITVANTPRLTLTIGATTKYANYVSGSGGSALLFRYTVEAGLLDSDGIAVAGTIDLNTTGTLQDGASNNLNTTLNSVASLLSVLVNSQNVAPAVAGASAGQAVNDNATVSPFSALTISDSDGDNVTTTVTLDTNAKGVFTSTSLSTSGFTGSGPYSLASTTTANAQTAIRQLVFDPSDNRVAVGASETTTFTVGVNDGSVTSNNTTTSVVSTSINDAPTNSVVPAVSGTASVGNALSSSTGTWSDVDPSTTLSYSYQWYRADDNGGTNEALITGASASSYNLTSTDAHKYLRVIVTANDGNGSADQSATSLRTAIGNSAPTNSVVPAITGSASVGSALNVDSGTWTDVDGDSVTYSYQWYRADDNSGTNEAAIAGATGTSFNLTSTDAHKYLRVVVTANDSNGSADQTATSLRTAIGNAAPTNTVVPAISGSASVGNSLSSSAGTWNDADGDTLSYGYQWYRADDNGGTNDSLITGATASSYSLTSTDAHKYLRVVVTANDSNGSADQSATSLRTAIGNSAPTNSIIPAISGSASVGSALSSNAGTWTDADGDTLSYSYQWYRADDNAGTNEALITGANASSYSLTSTDAHKYLRVIVTANDSNGSADQSATSLRTAIGNAAPTNTVAPAISGSASVGNSLSSSAGTWNDADGDTLSYGYQWYRADDNGGTNDSLITGATANSYSLTSADAHKYLRVVVTANDSNGSADQSATSLRTAIGNAAPTNTVAPAISGSASVGNSLSSSAGTWNDADGDTLSYGYQWYRADDNGGTNDSLITGATANSYSLTSADAHKYLRVVVTANDSNGSADQSATSLRTAIGNAAPTNTVAPAISGSASVGNSLSSSAGTWNDADGDTLSYGYQWYRADDNGGTNDSLITGATANSYSLTSADAHKYLRVVVTANDSNGSADQTATSLRTAIGNAAPTNTVAPAISGSASVGNSLSSSAGTWNDADGDTLSYGYQWYRADDNSGTNDSLITGATASSYSLTSTDAHKYLRVIVTANDSNGSADQTATSLRTAIGNAVPTNTVAPAISGSASVGNSLSSSAGTWNDADGDTLSYGYQWYRADDNSGTNDSLITGATANSYSLTSADAHKYLRVEVTADDSNGSADQTAASLRTAITNTAPSNTTPPAISGTVAVGNALSTSDGTWTDADNDSLSYSYQWLANGVNIGGATTNSYTLTTAEAHKAITVTVTANDSNGGSVSATSASSTVSNTAPNATSTAITTATEDSLYSYTLTASDADFDALTLSAPTLPTWLSFDSDTGVVRGTPRNNHVGTHAVSLRINDGALDTDQNFTLTVANSNDAPVVSGSPKTRAVVGVAYSFTISATDEDVGDSLSYVIANQPAWLNIDASTGLVSGTPTLGSQGIQAGVLVGANDGTVTSNLGAFNLAVIRDLDGDLVGDDVDTDIDGDGMPNDFETTHELNPEDASDAAGDADNDGILNLAEFTAGTNPRADDNPPSLTAPADLTGSLAVNATGLFTKVELGSPSSVDAHDGVITASSDADTHFAPGVHLITWTAEDAEGNSVTATQTLHVIPLVEFSKDQVSSEGATISVRAILNGPAPIYPVTVPYTVSGTAETGMDHDLADGVITIDSLNTEAVINFVAIDDGSGEGMETIVITMGTPTNAVVGPHSDHIIELLEGNVAPEVVLNATQSAGNTRIIARDGGPVVISSTVTDANPSDVHSYDWTATDNALSGANYASSTFSFDPADNSPGVYTLRLKVSDGESTATAQLTLNIVATAPTLASIDADNDGVNDDIEGYGDSDGDGIPDYQDAIDTPNTLQERTNNSSSFLIEAEPGVSLSIGPVAMQAGNGRSKVVKGDIENHGNNGAGAVMDKNYEFNAGMFDFVIDDLPAVGQSVQIVIPQEQDIPESAIYRKLMPGGWRTFVENDKNNIASAPGVEGYCPPPGDNAFETGLIEGYWCVQLTIEDGGPNDADLEANGRVEDPGGVAQHLNVPVTVKASGGGSGSLSSGVLLLLILSFALRMRKATRAMLVASLGLLGLGNAQANNDQLISNNPPVAVDDQFEVMAGQSSNLPILANDSDADGDPLRIIALRADSGQIHINADGSVRYTPALDFIGPTQLHYRIYDGGLSSPQSLRQTRYFNTHYGYKETAVAPSNHPALKEVAALLKRSDQASLTIEGHTYQEGNNSAQQALGLARASAVKDFLVDELNVNPQHIRIVSFADRTPVKNRQGEVSTTESRRSVVHFNGRVKVPAAIADATVNIIVVAPPAAAAILEPTPPPAPMITEEQAPQPEPEPLVKKQKTETLFKQQKLYLWTDAGLAFDTKSKGQINQDLADLNLNARVTDYNDSSLALQLGLGYRFNQHAALELGYADLGDAAITIDGSSSTPDQFADQVLAILPHASAGIIISGRGFWPIATHIDLSAQLGLWSWSEDNSVNINGAIAKQSNSGSDIIFGLGAQWQLHKKLSLRGGWQRFSMADETRDLLSIGLVFYPITKQ